MHVLESAGVHHTDGSPTWVEHLRVPDLSCGTYSLPVGAVDAQAPHTEDELYICTHGRATLWTPAATAVMTPGVVTFVPAGEEHRFVDILADFSAIVIFGPAELSRGSASKTA